MSLHTVGVPTEVKSDEHRVAVTPDGVRELERHGVEVVVQAGAGEGARITDGEYRAVGAEVVADAAEVWARADLICKVKEPQASELPLLAPMSEVAGRMSVQIGAHFLERHNGGRGVLMGGAPGVQPARVVVLGAGNVGWNAAWIAAGMEAEVVLIDKNLDRLRWVDQIHKGRIMTLASNRGAVERAVADADLVIGAVLVPGARAPHLVTNELVSRMRPGSVPLDDPLVAQMMDWGVAVVPALAAARPVTALVGVRPIPTDGLPCVGGVPGIPGYVEVVTHSGVTLAPLIARSLTDEMLREAGNPLLRPFRPDRFPLA